MDELIRNLLALQNLEFGGEETDDTAAQVAELRGKIPPPVLGHYDRLRVRGKKGLAVVNNQVCSGCHMRLPLAVIMTLRHGQDLQLCDNCGRYLYLPDETPGVPTGEEPKPKPVRSPRRKKKSLAPPDDLKLTASQPAPLQIQIQPRLSPE